MRRMIGSTFALLLLLGIAPDGARADDSECRPVAAGTSGLTDAAAQSRAEGLGYRVRRVTEDDGCILVKGFDAHGARIELKIDPSDGRIVRHDEDMGG